MSWLAPIWLTGLAAIAVPIVIHLLDRSKTVAVDWPTLRFLKLARQQSARRAKLKNILVLLARCLMIALLALAFAKPYESTEAWQRPPELPTTLVIVLDNSYSMGYRDAGGDESRFDRAKKAALEQLTNLQTGDEVALILANEQPLVMTDRPTRDWESVRKLIQEASLSTRGSEMGQALTAAYAVGNLDAPTEASATQPAQKEGKSPIRPAWRQVMVFTDLQASGWRRITDDKLIEQTAGVLATTIVNFGGDDPPNRFIRDVNVKDETAGGMIAVEVQVGGRAGVGRAGSELLTLWIDGQKAGTPQPVTGASDKVLLRAPLPVPGVHACMVSLEEDRLPLDDKAYFAVRVTGGSHLTIVDGDPSEVPSLAETYFLDAALRFAQAKATGITMERLMPNDLSTAPLDKGGCLILANVPRLDGSALTKVENFLRAGGAVFVTLGDKVDLAHYNKDWRFLPLTLDKRLGDPNRTRVYGVLIDQADHPIFTGVDLSATRFFAFVGSDPTTIKPGGRLLASFSNGSPYLVEGTFGAAPGTQGAASGVGGGRVLLSTGGIDADWSNLPYRRAFLPMVDRVVAYMTRQRMSSQSVPLGQVVRFTGPSTLSGKTLTIVAPDGTSQTLNAELDQESNQVVAEFRDTQATGVYRVEGDEAFSGGGAFAVNLDTRESILMPAVGELVQKSFGAHPIRLVQKPSGDLASWNTGPDQEQVTSRTEYWPWLVVAAFFVFVLETVLANYFTRRRRVEAPPTTEYLGTRRGEELLAQRVGAA